MKNWSGITHDRLIPLMVNLPTDFEPYGQRSREGDWGPDCSCGCKWFAALEGTLGYDWGVCCNPVSPRVGLLTFEHQGCKQYDDNPELAEWIEQQRAKNPNQYTREELLSRLDPAKTGRDRTAKSGERGLVNYVWMFILVPTLRVGTPACSASRHPHRPGTNVNRRDAERPGASSHAKRGNEEGDSDATNPIPALPLRLLRPLR